jgi:hypothetical protein
MALIGPLAAVAAVLGASGYMKFRHPDASLPALAALGLPARRSAVWTLGLTELALAAAALVWTSAAAAGLVAAWYLVLAVASTLLSTRHAGTAGAAVTCGCFGRSSTPPHPLQAAANVGSFVVAGTAALAGTEALLAVAADHPTSAAVLALQALVGAFLVIAVHRDLPAALRPRLSPPSFRLRPAR